MTRRLKIAAGAAAAIALLLLAMVPPGARQTAPLPATTVRGAFHIHSNRSDGSGTVDAIAGAAAEAGLQFIILTDHGDGTRPPDPPAYRGGVLTIDGVELNTTGGHYAVIDLPASPYPLAGTPADVVEDVRRLGGFGIAAHPGSPRPSLAWQEWDAAIDGLEWLNGDSEWRDEPRLPIARALLTYLFRAPESMGRLLDRPASVLQRWDALAKTRRVVALAGTDAHARLGFRQRTDPDMAAFHVPLPGYASTFKAFSNHVVLDAPLNGDAAADARRVLDAIRSGHVYSVVDALASPGSLFFAATSGSRAVMLGETLEIEGDVRLHADANAPPGTTLVLLRNGQRVREVRDGALDTNVGTEPAAYRIELYTAGGPGDPAVPWMLSNPIYAGLSASLPPASVDATPQSRLPAQSGEASREGGPNDTSVVEIRSISDPLARTFAGDPAIHWTFALAPGTPVGQFAAVRVPITGGLAAFDRVRFKVTASAPMRAWVQLRAPVGNTERWGKTFYTSTEPGMIDVAFAGFLPIGVTSLPRAPLDRVDSLLFVIDTLNTLPGTKGEITISEIAFVK
jgi:hypothetical protein